MLVLVLAVVPLPRCLASALALALVGVPQVPAGEAARFGKSKRHQAPGQRRGEQVSQALPAVKLPVRTCVRGAPHRDKHHAGTLLTRVPVGVCVYTERRDVTPGAIMFQG